ncbi:alpha/beta fold hydrolase [Pusillimonas sp. TS35]|uniref:YheT family hydrolase n=1 Tax=Paracandidimonas lactea TaxID=2895524 RepID=UPI0013690E8D|nr:alpha/beta fold hydrolase [Pusillimonas sp. TS35]
MTAQTDSSPCPCPPWLPGSHLQTLYGALVARYHRIAFVRERVDTPDGDFLDFDWTAPGIFSDRLANGSMTTPDPRLAHTAARRWMQPEDWAAVSSLAGTPGLILFHGLEGSSRSHYAQAIAQHFRARGWVVVIAHFRSCSGFPNRMARAYYSGDSADIAYMLQVVRERVPGARWHAVGVSMGGNAMLKYIGEQGAAAGTLIHAAAGISVPLDLAACGRHLSETRLGKSLYSHYFLRSMKAKVQEKARRFPASIDMLRLTHARTLREFDDAYTAPMHGYKNALDYWTRAASKPLLAAIEVPTLVLNARNDPFVPASSLPTAQECSTRVLLHQPSDGGHAGFVTGGFPGNLGWLPARLARYFDSRS